MGYYTYYTLTAQRDVPFAAEEREIINKAVFAMEDVEWEYIHELQWDTYAKWYSQDVDMYKLSVQFPDVLFELNGDGEESDDKWTEYWQNGSCQHCHMGIPPYDPTKMRKYALNPNGALVGTPDDPPEYSFKVGLVDITTPDLDTIL